MKKVFARPIRTGGPTDNLGDFLLAPADTDPDAIAVVEVADDGEVLETSFGQLRERVDAAVADLDLYGLEVGDRVVVEGVSSAAAITVLAACALRGLTFITAGPQTPPQRLRTIMEAAEPALYLQPTAGHREGIPAGVGAAHYGPEGLVLGRAPQPRPRHRRDVIGTDPAYIVFTSGTTGRPKGVVISHRAVISFLRGSLAQDVVTAGERVASTSPLQFDFSLADIGLSLGSGAAVVPVPRERLNWPRRFVGHLRTTGATQVHGVPSIWRQVLRHEPTLLEDLPLRRIMFSGEDFPLHELRELQSRLPNTQLINGYGATESMAASFTDVPNPLPAGLERLSIGRAHRGAEMMVLDAEQNPVQEPGRIGEIYLRSPALFSGYWGDPDATRAALIPDPHNPRSGQQVFRTGDLAYRDETGDLYFCGRRDTQVQIRGNRVELGEIERRLADFDVVAATVVLALPVNGENELHGFVVPRSADAEIDQTELRDFCRQTLPEYMIPRRVHRVAELPLTVNGKIDRARLSALAGVTTPRS